MCRGQGSVASETDGTARKSIWYKTGPSPAEIHCISTDPDRAGSNLMPDLNATGRIVLYRSRTRPAPRCGPVWYSGLV